MKWIFLILISAVFAGLIVPSHAQGAAACGAPPVFDRTTTDVEKTKGDLQGRAQALSRLFGSA